MRATNLFFNVIIIWNLKIYSYFYDCTLIKFVRMAITIFTLFFTGAKMESSGSDCDSNVDSEVSASAIPVSSHYQTGNYLHVLYKKNYGEKRKGR